MAPNLFDVLLLLFSVQGALGAAFKKEYCCMICYSSDQDNREPQACHLECADFEADECTEDDLEMDELKELKAQLATLTIGFSVTICILGVLVLILLCRVFSSSSSEGLQKLLRKFLKEKQSENLELKFSANKECNGVAVHPEAIPTHGIENIPDFSQAPVKSKKLKRQPSESSYVEDNSHCLVYENMAASFPSLSRSSELPPSTQQSVFSISQSQDVPRTASLH